jgi:hypothetical protein
MKTTLNIIIIILMCCNCFIALENLNYHALIAWIPLTLLVFIALLKEEIENESKA